MKTCVLLACFLATVNAHIPTHDYLPSVNIAMSRDFLSSSKSIINHRGYGFCNATTKSCLDAPAACRETSCCMTPIRENGAGVDMKDEGSCGCLDDSGPTGTSANQRVCMDPYTFHVSVEGSTHGKQHQADVQIFSIPAFRGCEEGSTTEVVKQDDGGIKIRITATTCVSANTQKGASRAARGLSRARFEGGSSVVFDVRV